MDFLAAMKGGERPPVGNSTDLERVLALPRRPPPDLGGFDGRALVEWAVGRFGRRNPSCRCSGRPCLLRPFPVQAWALHEMATQGGLLGAVGVGCGKTMLDILAPMAVPNCKLAVLLIPPNLKEQLRREYLALAEHFVVPSVRIDDWGVWHPGRPALHVVAYSQLSRREATELLESFGPDLIIADEAHKLRHADTATVRRFIRYFRAHLSTRLCAWSGTMTTRSIRDYAHLSALALREGSPLPIARNVVEEWCLALDPSDWVAPEGALRKLRNTGESLYDGFRRRVVETRGFVATTGSQAQMSLVITERKPPKIPDKVQDMLQEVRSRWRRPDGEELVDPMAVAKSARELACGFFYRWVFPRGEAPDLIARWFAARRAWHSEVRDALARARPHFDSVSLLEAAAMRAWGDAPRSDKLPEWRAASWCAWRDVRDLVEPEDDTVWVDDWLARDAAGWARGRRGIVWCAHRAFGQRVSELAGLSYHDGGRDGESRILAERGDRSVVASIRANGTGRDGLQRLFAEQLIANPPANAESFEQVLGRLHREGQVADEVTCEVYRHTPELAASVDQALRQARYVEGTLGNLQKLLCSTVSFDLDGVTINAP